MIRQQSLYAVHESAAACADANIALVAVPSSPLDELCQMSCSPQAFGIGKPIEKYDNDFLDIVNYSQQRDMSGGVPHDDAMARVVELASKVISGNLDLARNTVNPIIKCVVESATKYADSRSRSGLSPLNVVTNHYPAPYDNPILAELVSRYSDTLNSDMKLTVLFPPLAADGIRERCMTGISRLDGDIASWLAGLADEFVEAVYNDVFGYKAPTLTNALGIMSTRASTALIVFLLARRFMDDLPDGLNIDLGSYKEYVSALMSQSGRQVVNVIRHRADNDKMNYLIVNSPSDVDPMYGVTQGDVQVNGDVYARWLKAGGTPEVLFGAIQSNVDDLSFSGLITNAEKHATAWRRVVQVLKTKVDFDRFNYFLEGMRLAILEQITILPDTVRTAVDQTYKERLTEVLRTVKGGGVDEPWVIARKLVCRVFFPNTEAEMVLWAISDQCKTHPDLDIREAALLATIEIVANWVAKQFTVNAAGIL